MQLWLDEGDPTEQLLDRCVLVFAELLGDRSQFCVRILVYGSLDTLNVSCVLRATRISAKFTVLG